MAKRLVAKVGTYTDRDGNEKGRYVEVGVILSNDNGEFALLDPSVNLAGVMLQQRVAGMGKRDSDRVMTSIFDNDQQRQQPQRRGGGGQDTAPPKGGEFEDDIPFVHRWGLL